MNQISRNSSRFVAILAASFAMMAGNAYADQPSESAPPWHPNSFIQQLETLHDQLMLTPAQQQSWQKALATMKKNHAAEVANQQAFHQQLETLQQQPIMDLNALYAAQQRCETQNALLREKTMRTWLTVYNSLDDQQKTTVSTALQQHFAHMDARHEKMHAGWHKQSEQSNAPPPPSASPAPPPGAQQ